MLAHSDDASLESSLRTAFIDADGASSDARLRTTLLTNDVRHGVKVSAVLLEELERCTSFAMSVAFVTEGGIMPFLMTLRALEEHGVHGRILTTDYQLFTEPKALRRLLAFRNLEVRLFHARSAEGFHTKGYIFQKPDYCTFIIGSSNLTSAALSTNLEWNARMVTRAEGKLAKEISEEFERLWAHEESRPAGRVIDAYEALKAERDREMREAAKLLRESREAYLRAARLEPLEPNSMQRAFVGSLEKLIRRGEKRALLISATGTGKTYAAAFAVRALCAGRVLFLVHREQIARQALASFERVLGGNAGDYGLLTGGEDTSKGARFVFATIQTVCRGSRLKTLAAQTFDFIIVDEVHRAGAPGYQKVMEALHPRFWLGMTGSPDRTDGFDIYGLFHHNIAHEIRLQEALEEDLLCPFHYFGIQDLRVEGRTRDAADFALIELESRLDHVVREATFYGSSGSRVRGLVFVSTKDEARRVADGLTKRGFPSLALTGEDRQEARLDAIERLTHTEGLGRLDYIVTVDIFNEGVDIPEVNQVLLLRPTESVIIFVQQLGRGLRKAKGKDFVVVLDFIGACETNFLIPAALSGDRTYTKERLRRFVYSGSRLIPGASSVQFDEVSKEQIFRSIDRANTSEIALLRSAYETLKFMLGRIPDLGDFEIHGSIDPVKFLTHKSFRSYYRFLKKYEKSCSVSLSAGEAKFIDWMSQKLGSSIRPSEALVLELILEKSNSLKAAFAERFSALTGLKASGAHLLSVETVLTNQFERKRESREAWAGAEILEVDASTGEWRPQATFLKALQNPDFRSMVESIAGFVLARWKKLYSDKDLWSEGTLLQRGATYTYEDVCRMLDWSRNITAQNLGGYFYDESTKTFPVFVNYEKEEGAIQYEDRFVSEREFESLSKRNRTTDSTDALRMQKKPPFEATRIYLFVRRNKEDDEAKSFYFLGEIDPAGLPRKVVMADGARAFKMPWRLRHAVPADLYGYLRGK